jgi:hypothetical protein
MGKAGQRGTPESRRGRRIEVLLTTDKNITAQQNLKARAIAIVVLGNSQWRIVQRHLRKIAAAVSAATPGSYSEVDIPFR